MNASRRKKILRTHITHTHDKVQTKGNEKTKIGSKLNTRCACTLYTTHYTGNVVYANNFRAHYNRMECEMMHTAFQEFLNEKVPF